MGVEFVAGACEFDGGNLDFLCLVCFLQKQIGYTLPPKNNESIDSSLATSATLGKESLLLPKVRVFEQLPNTFTATELGNHCRYSKKQVKLGCLRYLRARGHLCVSS